MCNLQLNLFLESKPNNNVMRKSRKQEYSKEAIYSEFFKLLSHDRESKLTNLKLELERIESLKNELGVTEEISLTIGNKRRATK